ncbi:GNAT family N-acetyltransferase [Oscillibacter sp. MSJ-2]|uniref:GNAT family N-acetyltransferase n=1 Tax=Dysosmobacter acutus TaxID=2841504 RepID=A0ABS6F6E0_9FIRM|nr:GNAT family N-acetyltransferase [Dysosmobacter acutus]MBU5625737.1 GNAT family N-acetyltransferase [Dysosmobacter acutus]
MEFRLANRDDLEALVENRMEFVQAVKGIDRKEDFRTKTRAFLSAHLEQPDFAAFIAVEEGRIAASCMACVFAVLPTEDLPAGRRARVMNVYTQPAHRRSGYAEALVRMMAEEMKRRGVEELRLECTEMGRPVYEKVGFEKLDNQMRLKLL